MRQLTLDAVAVSAQGEAAEAAEDGGFDVWRVGLELFDHLKRPGSHQESLANLDVD